MNTAADSLLMRIVEAAAWRASQVSILFDWCSPLMARQSHRQPSVRRTGAAAPGQRPFQWSIEHPHELLWLHPSLRVHKTYDLMRECGAFARTLGAVHKICTGRLFYGCSHLTFTP